MSDHDGGEFKRHDPAYAEWLSAHPKGFVMLYRRYTIHRATCSRVRPLRQPERKPGLLGVGASCSRSIAPLEYALMMIEGAVHLCARCQPQSDPVGFGMHADYAVNMRTHLAEEAAVPLDQIPRVHMPRE